jgi:predicted RNase H-like HicB family nuclease
MNLYEIQIKVEQLKDGGDYEYIATSPDPPGLLVAGDTVEEVLTLAPQVAAARHNQ